MRREQEMEAIMSRNEPSAATWIILTLGFLLPAVSAHATCISPGFNPGVPHFCNGCRYEGTMRMARNETCERPYRPSPGMVVQFLSHRLVQHAKHGIAGLNGTTFAYQPAKGFSGTDDFAIEVNYRDSNNTGKFTVHWNIDVQ